MSVYYMLTRSIQLMQWRERNGTKLKNEYGLELFIEHAGRGDFVITEAHTGLKVGQGGTRKKAIENLEENVSQSTIESVHKSIKSSIEAHGESPLFTDEPKYPVRPLEKEVTHNG